MIERNLFIDPFLGFKSLREIDFLFGGRPRKSPNDLTGFSRILYP
jgi:hypothetical protein